MDDKDQNPDWSGFGQNIILCRILSSQMIYRSKVFKLKVQYFRLVF